MHIVNGAFIDLDDCERDVILLSKKVQVLDTLLKSKVELQDGFKKQEKLNQELKKELKECWPKGGQILTIVLKKL